MSSPGLWPLAALCWALFGALAAAVGGIAARGPARPNPPRAPLRPLGYQTRTSQR